MNKYHFFYLIWLLPFYFLLMSLYQGLIYRGINYTYNSGASYVSDVLDFDVKQIAAQTSGYVVLTFQTDDGETIEEQLSLSVQMAQSIMNTDRIPVRYQPDSFREIVIVSTYDLQRNVIRINLVVTFIGFVATAIIGYFTTRFARRKIRDGEDEMIIERLDNDNTED